MVALAIIGAGLEGFSVPLLAAVGTGPSLSEEFDGADTEGERDEAPEDLNELTWCLVSFASRGEKRDGLRARLLSSSRFPTW